MGPEDTIRNIGVEWSGTEWSNALIAVENHNTGVLNYALQCIKDAGCRDIKVFGEHYRITYDSADKEQGNLEILTADGTKRELAFKSRDVLVDTFTKYVTGKKNERMMRLFRVLEKLNQNLVIPKEEAKKSAIIDLLKSKLSELDSSNPLRIEWEKRLNVGSTMEWNPEVLKASMKELSEVLQGWFPLLDCGVPVGVDQTKQELTKVLDIAKEEVRASGKQMTAFVKAGITEFSFLGLNVQVQLNSQGKGRVVVNEPSSGQSWKIPVGSKAQCERELLRLVRAQSDKLYVELDRLKTRVEGEYQITETKIGGVEKESISVRLEEQLTPEGGFVSYIKRNIKVAGTMSPEEAESLINQQELAAEVIRTVQVATGNQVAVHSRTALSDKEWIAELKTHQLYLDWYAQAIVDCLEEHRNTFAFGGRLFEVREVQPALFFLPVEYELHIFEEGKGKPRTFHCASRDAMESVVKREVQAAKANYQTAIHTMLERFEEGVASSSSSHPKDRSCSEEVYQEAEQLDHTLRRAFSASFQHDPRYAGMYTL